MNNRNLISSNSEDNEQAQRHAWNCESMRARQRAMALMLLAGAMVLAGCAGSPGGTHIEPPVPTATKTQGEPMKAELTWQEAKAQAQTMELEIAALIPKDKVNSIVQKETGVLLSCNKAQHNWNASTTVTVLEGTKLEPIVRSVGAHYLTIGTKVSVDTDVNGRYRIQIDPPAPGESYIVSEGFSSNEIRIASGSPCFTLPEGTYPGGDF